jgi:hypothetical protein
MLRNHCDGQHNTDKAKYQQCQQSDQENWHNHTSLPVRLSRPMEAKAVPEVTHVCDLV